MAGALRGGGGGQLDQPGLIDRLLRRDRLIVSAALAILVALAWTYLVLTPHGAHDAAAADGMAGMGMAGLASFGTRAWGAADYAMLFAMWSVMMVAMMLPSAAPTILLVTGVARRRRETGAAPVRSGLFLAGYLAVWTGFSAVAALGQWMLHRASLLSPGMASASPRLSGAILLLAGLYQFLPLKNVCLTHCRSPLGWLGAEWREGAGGAFLMGARHGAFCLGCCWVLMGLLFVAGVMNLVWVAAIAALVLVEKVAPGGRIVGRAAGVGMAVWGLMLLVS